MELAVKQGLGNSKVLQMHIPKLDETKVNAVSKEDKVMSTITAGKSRVQETMFKIMRFMTSLKVEEREINELPSSCVMCTYKQSVKIGSSYDVRRLQTSSNFLSRKCHHRHLLLMIKGQKRKVGVFKREDVSQ